MRISIPAPAISSFRRSRYGRRGIGFDETLRTEDPDPFQADVRAQPGEPPRFGVRRSPTRRKSQLTGTSPPEPLDRRVRASVISIDNFCRKFPLDVMMQARIVAAGLLFLWSGCNAFATDRDHAQAGTQTHAPDLVTVRTQSWEIRFSPSVAFRWNGASSIPVTRRRARWQTGAAPYRSSMSHWLAPVSSVPFLWCFPTITCPSVSTRLITPWKRAASVDVAF